MSYAIIRLAGKQYRVQEGDRFLVDRLGQDEGKSFHPDVLLFADNGKTEFAPKGVQVTAKVVSHTLGEKVRVGKYRPKSGYKRHTGHRSKLTEIEIQKVARKAPARKPATENPATEKPAAEKKPAPKEKTTTAAKKPAAKKEST
jgi:large subunit ribosomal protein L21